MHTQGLIEPDAPEIVGVHIQPEAMGVELCKGIADQRLQCFPPVALPLFLGDDAPHLEAVGLAVDAAQRIAQNGPILPPEEQQEQAVRVVDLPAVLRLGAHPDEVPILRVALHGEDGVDLCLRGLGKQHTAGFNSQHGSILLRCCRR